MRAWTIGLSKTPGELVLLLLLLLLPLPAQGSVAIACSLLVAASSVSTAQLQVFLSASLVTAGPFYYACCL